MITTNLYIYLNVKQLALCQLPKKGKIGLKNNRLLEV